MLLLREIPKGYSYVLNLRSTDNIVGNRKGTNREATHYTKNVRFINAKPIRIRVELRSSGGARCSLDDLFLFDCRGH